MQQRHHPSQQEIEQACQSIRANWSNAERRRRRVQAKRRQTWIYLNLAHQRRPNEMQAV